jgi:hypothetical protein
VSTTIAAGTSIPFSLRVTDTYGTTISLAFNYVALAIDQRVSVSSVTVKADTNGDGKVSPGETGWLAIALDNSGTSDALGLTASLTTTLAGVTITNGANLALGTIRAGYSACATVQGATVGACYASSASSYPSIAVSTAITVGTIVSLSLAITDAYGNKYSLPASITVQ